MDIYERFINEPVKGFIDRILEFLPNILAAVLIFIFGMFAGWLAKVVLKKVFTIFKLDRHAERTGITKMLQKSGFNEPLSQLLAKIAGGFIVFAFFVVALGTLKINAIQGITEKLFFYLPNVFIALIIIVIGFILGNFFGRAALIASVNAGIHLAGAVGKCIKYLIILISISMALELLGIGRDTVIISYGIILSGFVLAIAIAFGLGGRDAAKEFIERKLKGNQGKNDIQHL
jgi:hypothetical protein